MIVIACSFINYYFFLFYSEIEHKIFIFILVLIIGVICTLMCVRNNKKWTLYIEIAKQEAAKSTMLHSHGSILLCNNKIVAAGFNTYRDYRYSTHAEMSCLMNADWKRLSKHSKSLKLIVIRLNSAGNIVQSKPCSSCQKLIHKFGICTVYHS